MKIIIHGKMRSPKRKKIIRCEKCKCIHIAHIEDAYIDKTVLGNTAYYADCPECKYSNNYQSMP